MKRKNSIISLIFLSLIALSSCSTSNKNPFENEVKVEERTLNFYALNDFHGAFMCDESYHQTGLSKIGTIISS